MSLPFMIEVREGAPKDQILLAPKRRDDETDEEYYRRCGLIKNIEIVQAAAGDHE